MYIVIELQTDKQGQTAHIVNDYENKDKAESKFHTILAFAAESNVPIHAATILNERGDIERSEFYRHETPPAKIDAEDSAETTEEVEEAQ